MTYEEMQAQFEALKAENEALRAKIPQRKVKELSFKVSDKGALSVYGLGRFPVSLYVNQWTRLFEAMDKIRVFIEENKTTLALEKPKAEVKEAA